MEGKALKREILDVMSDNGRTDRYLKCTKYCVGSFHTTNVSSQCVYIDFDNSMPRSEARATASDYVIQALALVPVS